MFSLVFFLSFSPEANTSAAVWRMPCSSIKIALFHKSILLKKTGSFLQSVKIELTHWNQHELVLPLRTKWSWKIFKFLLTTIPLSEWNIITSMALWPFQKYISICYLSVSHSITQILILCKYLTTKENINQGKWFCFIPLVAVNHRLFRLLGYTQRTDWAVNTGIHYLKFPAKSVLIQFRIHKGGNW